jgi:hypothetical protein
VRHPGYPPRESSEERRPRAVFVLLGFSAPSPVASLAARVVR